MLPFAFLLAGPLADNVFEPAVGQPGWETVAPLVGNSIGSGMGLLLVFGGVLTAILTLLVYAVPAVRHLERDLPDFVPENQAVPADDRREVSSAFAVSAMD
jgi:MFS transporter, DHA3 family, macrolide efflux protein